MPPRKLIGPRRKSGAFYYRRPKPQVRRGVNTSKVSNTTGFPDRMLTKFEYREAKEINSVLGADTTFDYRLNGLYDPRIALGGHQPMWTDQYRTIYNKYRVYKCMYEIKLVALSTNGTPLRAATICSAQQPSDIPATITDAWELNRTVNRLIPAGPDKVTVLKGTISLPKLQGQTSVAFKGDDDNASGFNGDPVNWAVLRFIGQSANSAVEECKWTVDVKLTYFAECFDRKTPVPS